MSEAMDEHLPDDGAAPDERPSKSQVKRDLHALLDLGRELIALPAARLAQLPLDENLRDAIALAQRIHAHEGRRRQTHYVGKLLRRADTETLRRQLAEWASGSRDQTRAMHRLESLRDRLLDDDQALTQLLESFPHLDIQALRAQIRAARKEAKDNLSRAPGREPLRKHYRALFQTLKHINFEDDTSGHPAGND